MFFDDDDDDDVHGTSGKKGENPLDVNLFLVFAHYVCYSCSFPLICLGVDSENSLCLNGTF